MKASFLENSGISASFEDGNSLSAGFGSVVRTKETGLLFNTTEGWNSSPNLVSIKDIVYVYTDHRMSEDGQPIPGFKVGDGTSYLIDMPFNDDIMADHISDSSMHISEEERAFWNNKVTAYIDAENLNNLVLSKE